MTYTPPGGVTIGTFTADTLPASFSAPADAVLTYKIYGTTEGAGVETEKGEPTGYKLPMTVESEEQSQDIPIYIGSTKLGAEEYLDYGEQKVYKRTENLVPEISTANGWRPGYYSAINGYVSNNSNGEWLSPLIDIGSMTSVTITYKRLAAGDSPSLTISFFDSNGNYISNKTDSTNACAIFNNFPSGASKFCYAFRSYCFTEQEIIENKMLTCCVSGSTPPETYIPYLQPTDPPVPLPTITASGETTITTTETLGDVEFTGDWLAIMGSTEAESIDISFTVDADEYIAFATVNEGSLIQVFDTITMPSSAGSFTLQVVSWGRERYTETVYSALS